MHRDPSSSMRQHCKSPEITSHAVGLYALPLIVPMSISKVSVSDHFPSSILRSTIHIRIPILLLSFPCRDPKDIIAPVQHTQSAPTPLSLFPSLSSFSYSPYQNLPKHSIIHTIFPLLRTTELNVHVRVHGHQATGVFLSPLDFYDDFFVDEALEHGSRVEGDELDARDGLVRVVRGVVCIWKAYTHVCGVVIVFERGVVVAVAKVDGALEADFPEIY